MSEPIIPQLPDDIAIRCIAQITRQQHPNLCLVSRAWRAALKSHILFVTRSSLGISEPALILAIRLPSAITQWFIINPPNPKPNPIPNPPIAAAGASCAALGHRLFILGGSVNGVPSATVQIFDAGDRTWSIGPRMSTAREFAAAAALGGRIFAVGGCLPSPDSWSESLDPSTGKWAPVDSPPHIREKWMHGYVVLGGRILAVADHGGVIYDPAVSEIGARWQAVRPHLDNGWKGRAAVVDGVLYSYDFLGKIKGYIPEIDQWRPLEGVEKELPKFLCGATLANLGGLLCLVWEGRGKGRREMTIEWAGIRVFRKNDGGLRGSIMWVKPVILSVPKGTSIAHCVALEL